MNLPKSFQDKLSLPVIAAPMFLVSGPDLVVECCKAGVVGTFPALNQRTSEGFEEWLIEIKERLAEANCETPFGVNLIVHGSNPRLRADLELCVKHKVPLIITSLGAVSDVVDAVHSYGGVVFHDIIKKRHAEKAAEAGVDGLITVCAGAGGHAGTLHPFALIAEVRKFFKGQIILSGAISTGQDIAAALQAGADIAYMGTRFINTKESRAMEEYKQMIIDSNTDDIFYTKEISGVYANFLKPSLRNAGYEIGKHDKEEDIDFGKEMDTDNKAWKDIWSAGQGVTAIDDNPTTAELVARLREEFITAIKQQQTLLDTFAK